MKKILLTMAFVLTALGNAWADDDFTADDITIPSGNSATLEIRLTNPDHLFKQMLQFVLELPEGVTVVPGSAKLNNERFEYNDGTGYVVRAGISFNENKIPPGYVVEAGAAKYPDGQEYGGEPLLINGTSGVVVTIKLQTTLPQESPALTGYLKNIEVPYRGSGAMKIAERPFTIRIGEPLEVKELYETYDDDGYISSSGKAVDAIVYRSIKANLWSTICLPFDMTEAQVKAAFGDDVELADLTSWSCKGTLPEVDEINLVFSPVNSIKEHHPYLIKTKGPDDITSFTVNNVIITKITPTIEIPFNNSGNNCKCAMTGTYKKRYVPKENFFINNETFWRAKNKTTNIKGFRAFFKFNYYDADEDEDVTIMINETNESRVSFSFIDDATRIKDIDANGDDDRIFNLSGQQVENPAKKGLYITKGKKVVIK